MSDQLNWITYKRFYIHGSNLKIRSKRSLTFQAFDKLLDTIVNLPHSKQMFFWRKSTSFFVRFDCYSKCDLEPVLNILVIIAGINVAKGNVSMFTDDMIIYKYEPN